jgi:hypothetical protein
MIQFFFIQIFFQMQKSVQITSQGSFLCFLSVYVSVFDYLIKSQGSFLCFLSVYVFDYLINKKVLCKEARRKLKRRSYFSIEN